MSTLRTGETLRVTDPGVSYDAHLWIVLSKPELDAEHVLIVNLTSWRSDKDQACVLDVGDHPYVKQRTCVNYADSKVVNEKDIVELLNDGLAKKDEPVSVPLLERIREGAMTSRYMPLDRAQLLVDQGLVVSEE